MSNRNCFENMNGTKFKAYISKYALSEGILEKELETAGTGYASEIGAGGAFMFFGRSGRDCHTSRDEAVARAKLMRQKKIGSLKRQIAKLEGLSFD